MKKHLIIGLWLVLITSLSHAQTPNLINYQGVASDDDGPITGTISLRMSILDGLDGPALYTETHEMVAAAGGLFSLQIGGGAPTLGTFQAIVWASGDKYLQVEMDPLGGNTFQTMGTAQLVSVPFALYAEEAGNVDDADADPTNEIELPEQVLADAGLVLTADGEGGVAYTNLSSDDADNNPTNEIQDLQIEGNNLSITGNDEATIINLSSYLDGAFSTSSNVTSNASGDYYMDDFVFGSPSLAADGDAAHNRRMFFDKTKAAFRAGDSFGDAWNDTNLGPFSVAFGFGTVALKPYAVAMGNQSQALEQSSTAFGMNTMASGAFSTALGHSTIASGTYSTAIGQATTASGVNSFAAGQFSAASGQIATAIGLGAIASGGYSVAIGQATEASGLHSIALGGAISARSYSELVVGVLSTDYAPISADSFDPSDRLFVIGNGTDDNNRSNAMVVYKSGDMEINGQLSIVVESSGGDPAIGVDGSASGANSNTGIRGFAHGWALSENIGGDFQAHDGGNNNYGIVGLASGTGVNNSGVSGWAEGATGSNTAIEGNAYSITGDNYGASFNAYGITTGTNYGIYATASNGGTNWAGYFQGDVVIAGNLEVGAYTLPSTDGTNDQVIVTDGNGNLSWGSQELLLDGDMLSIAGGETQIPIGSGTNTDHQTLSFDGTNLSITNGSPIDISGVDNQNAAEVVYDNSGTGLGSTDVQAALTELDQDFSTNAWHLGGNANGALSILGTTDSHDLSIQTNASEAIRVTSDGNVGIGTVPDAPLQVAGGSNADLDGVSGLFDRWDQWWYSSGY